MREGHVLLGRQFAGPYRGLYYGLEVVPKRNETAVTAIIREAAAVFGVDLMPKNIRTMGELVYHHAQDPDRRVSLYLGLEPTGQPRKTATVWPIWYAAKHPPFMVMPNDFAYWLPQVLRHKQVHGELWQNQNGHLLRHSLTFGHQDGGTP